MADIRTDTYVLKYVMNFADGDTRALSIPNPKTAEELSPLLGSLQTLLQETKAFVGDKASAEFVGLSDAKLVQTAETKLDLDPHQWDDE